MWFLSIRKFDSPRIMQDVERFDSPRTMQDVERFDSLRTMQDVERFDFSHPHGGDLRRYARLDDPGMGFVQRPFTRDSLQGFPPTGRADFPHPAFGRGLRPRLRWLCVSAEADETMDSL